jgi:hypothetical protein
MYNHKLPTVQSQTPAMHIHRLESFRYLRLCKHFVLSYSSPCSWKSQVPTRSCKQNIFGWKEFWAAIFRNSQPTTLRHERSSRRRDRADRWISLCYDNRCIHDLNSNFADPKSLHLKHRCEQLTIWKLVVNICTARYHWNFCLFPTQSLIYVFHVFITTNNLLFSYTFLSVCPYNGSHCFLWG